jgi:hypothetical protein
MGSCDPAKENDKKMRLTVAEEPAWGYRWGLVTPNGKIGNSVNIRVYETRRDYVGNRYEVEDKTSRGSFGYDTKSGAILRRVKIIDREAEEPSLRYTSLVSDRVK